MSNAILMSGGADDIDFMIHGLFSYQLFGHTCMYPSGNACDPYICDHSEPEDKARDRSAGWFSERDRASRREVRWNRYGDNGKDSRTEVFKLYLYNLRLYLYQQYLRSVRSQTTNSGLWYNTCTWSYYILPDPYHAV